MCWECEGEPLCLYCGTDCYGFCDDPDSCASCWPFRGSHDDENSFSEMNDENVEECMENGCQCACHEDFIKALNFKFDDESESWVIQDSEEEVEEEYVHEGVFPLLDLAGEIRAKIYDYTMLADGKQRNSGFFKGRIHTSILSTCRQINSEARHVPLTVNELCFQSSLDALNFFGFYLAPSQRNLVTSMHLDLGGIPELHHPSFRMLMKQLAKHKIIHLGITLMGPLEKSYFTSHDCFTLAFGIMKYLKSFDLILGSYEITEKEKKEIQESVREVLVKGYVKTLPGPKLKVRKMKGGCKVAVSEGSSQELSSKRKASPDSPAQAPKKNAKKAKTAHNARPKTRSSLSATTKASVKSVREDLLKKYAFLDAYARTFDTDASGVSIRLDQARTAAEASDQKLFGDKVASVLRTLNGQQAAIKEQLAKINGARDQLPVFLEMS